MTTETKNRHRSPDMFHCFRMLSRQSDLACGRMLGTEKPALLLSLALLVSSLALGSCTVEEHYRNGELVGRTIGIGIVSATSCQSDAEVFDSRSYGATVSDRGLAVGYSSTSITCLPPDDCRTLFFVRSQSDVTQLKDLIGDLEDICIERRN